MTKNNLAPELKKSSASAKTFIKKEQKDQNNATTPEIYSNINHNRKEGADRYNNNQIQQSKNSKKETHTRGKAKKKIDIHTQTREASQDSKNSLQAVIARALKDKEEANMKQEEKINSDRKSIPGIVTRERESHAEKTEKDLEKLAHLTSSSYTDTGIAPSTQGNSGDTNRPSFQNREKQEAAVDIIRDILGA